MNDDLSANVSYLRDVNLREAAKTDFGKFILYVNRKYVFNWHHALLANSLNKFANGEIKRLMIFMPPRHGKSELVSRYLPAYLFGRNPRLSVIGASYNISLASRMNRDVQRIIQSERYGLIFPETSLGSGKENTKNEINYLKNTEFFEIVKYRGSYRAAGVGTGITGMGFDFGVIDDPIKDWQEAKSKTVRNNLWEWYASTFYTRAEKDASILLTQTRWHEDDLAGRILSASENDNEADKWTVLSLPAIKEGEAKNDKRQIGEPLWPDRYGPKRLQATRATIGEKIWQSLYQQNPNIEGGSIFKDFWWNYYDKKPTEFLQIVQFWDTAQKVGLSNDYSVGATWGQTESGYYLLGLWRGKKEAPELKKIFIEQYGRHQPDAVVIEDASSGSSMIQILKRETAMPIISYRPKKDKEIRAIAASPSVEAGLCYLPSSQTWTKDFVSEHTKFPDASNDDIVDTTSMMIEYFSKQTFNPRVRSL